MIALGKVSVKTNGFYPIEVPETDPLYITGILL